jgi:aminoglycoside N3'-acetyltransferase
MLALDTKVLFYDVGFGVFTFIHYLEHRFREQAPVKVYREEPLTAVVVDPVHGKFQVKTYVFSPDAIARRNPGALQEELTKRGRLIRRKIGNASLMLINTRDALRCVQDLVSQGKHFYRS